MPILEFISNLVDSLAWPVAVVVVILIFRKEFLSLIPALKKLKFKEFEAEFEAQLKEVSQETEASGSCPQGTEPIVAEQEIEYGVFLKPRSHYYTLAEFSQRSAIMEVWLELESAAADAYAKLIKPGMKIFMPPRQIGKYLLSEGVISEGEYRSFASLSDLRNRSAHEPNMPELNKALTREYIDFSLNLAKKIREITKQR